MKSIKLLSIIGVMSAFSSGATADVLYTIDNGATEYTFGSVTDVFSGPATMSKSCFGIPINLGCDLAIGGTIEDNGTPNGLDLKDLTVSVSGGSSGLLKCSDIKVSIPNGASLSNISAPVTYADPTPILFDLPVVNVDTICGSCSGPLTAKFFNGSTSGKFEFMGTIGSCGVAGTLSPPAITPYKVRVN